MQLFSQIFSLVHFDCQFLNLSVLLFLQVKEELEGHLDVAFSRIIEDINYPLHFIIVGPISPQVITECLNLKLGLGYGRHLGLCYFDARLDLIFQRIHFSLEVLHYLSNLLELLILILEKLLNAVGLLLHILVPKRIN